MHDPIKVFVTGGTIDDLEYENEINVPRNRQSIIPGFIEKLSHESSRFHTEILMFKDSQFITDADRSFILKKILESVEKHILITHGTKTMAATAKFLGLKRVAKTIVLTGCMTLPSQDSGHDALRSLAFALERIQKLPPGVYIAMQNQIFAWDNVRKNIKLGKFEAETVSGAASGN